LLELSTGSHFPFHSLSCGGQDTKEKKKETRNEQEVKEFDVEIGKGRLPGGSENQIRNAVLVV